MILANCHSGGSTLLFGKQRDTKNPTNLAPRTSAFVRSDQTIRCEEPSFNEVYEQVKTFLLHQAFTHSLIMEIMTPIW